MGVESFTVPRSLLLQYRCPLFYSLCTNHRAAKPLVSHCHAYRAIQRHASDTRVNAALHKFRRACVLGI